MGRKRKKKRKKRILFVINTMGNAGAEHALLALLHCLDREKYELSLYVLLGQGQLMGHVPEGVRLLNRDYTELPVLSGEGRKQLRRTVLRDALTGGAVFRRLPYLARNFADMCRKHKILPEKLLWRLVADGSARTRKRYDLAVAFLEGGAAYYVADYVNAAKKAAFIHIDYGMAGYTRELDLDCYLSFDRVFAVSDEVREAFLKAYPECESRTAVFHNILDVSEIHRLAREPGGFTDIFEGLRILTVGRLTEQKAYDLAVEALYLLKQRGRKVRWYVLGEGDRRKALEHQIAALGLEKDFLLLGQKENPYPYYAQTDLYVHATRFEGKSIAIEEAQTLGCAILASDCSGNREQITEGVDGRLCALTAENIAEGIVWMLDHPKERQRYKEAAARKKNFDLGEIRQLLSLLDEGIGTGE
ncbi:MAG: glycosyltransferase [Lachnospiraceae bacterium]|nr:glycosyltransferase [Lachnospiraceae bacterium]